MDAEKKEAGIYFLPRQTGKSRASEAVQHTGDDFRAYAVGLCAASVCTSLPIEQALARMNKAHPTGISSQWELSEDETFRTGEANPFPCPDHPETHTHFLLNC